MPVSDAKKKANSKWNRSKDNIMIRPDKETGSEIRAAAAEAGQSNQQYILQATLERMHGSPSLSPEDQRRVDQHIEKTGEAAPAFISRAITDTIDRDNQLLQMGLKPKTE